jgi:hypothetical protein
MYIVWGQGWGSRAILGPSRRKGTSGETEATMGRRKLVERVRFVFVLAALVAIVGSAGCGDVIDWVSGNSPPKKKDVAVKGNGAKPKTVVVNKGMSKKEEKNLNGRLDELEKEVEAQNKQDSKNKPDDSRTGQPNQQVEDQVRAAAEAYYQAAAARDWGYTYEH